VKRQEHGGYANSGRILRQAVVSAPLRFERSETSELVADEGEAMVWIGRAAMDKVFQITD